MWTSGGETWVSPWVTWRWPEAGLASRRHAGPEHATVAVEFKHNEVLKPGATLKTFRTFVEVHQGDYFRSLWTIAR